MRHFVARAAVLAALLGAVVWPEQGQAAVPGQVQLEGVLMTAAGSPPPDGSYKLSFALYASADEPNPAWTEGPVTVEVKNGLYAYALGTSKALDPVVLGQISPWLGLQVEGEPELARKPLRSTVYALRAGVAEGLECSGCVTAAQLDPKALADYAKTASLAKVAQSGQYADLQGVPDLAAYAKKADLAAVAASGKYADLLGLPTLATVATSGKYGDLVGAPTLATVATSGLYADLKGAPALGKSCGTGLVVTGLKSDGTLECGAALDPANLPADTLDKISQGVLTNFVTSTVVSAAMPKDIPDNNPIGTGDVLEVGDLGKIVSATVHVHLTNSDFTGLKVTLKGPGDEVFVLWDGGKGSGALDTTYPKPTAPVSGDFGALVGKSPKGKWTLFVTDTLFKDNGNDGQLLGWDLAFTVHSGSTVQVKGNLVDGSNRPFGRIAHASSDALATGKSLSVVTGLTTPAVQAQAWVWEEAGKRWAQVATGSEAPCSDCGDGSEGDFVSSGNSNLTGGVRKFKSFTIKAGDTVTVTGGSPLDLRVQGKVVIAGTLQLSGGKGGDATSCCPDNPGGAGGGGGGAAGGTGPGGGGSNSGGGSGGGGGGCASSYGAGGGGAGHDGSGKSGTISPNSCSSPGGGGGSYGDSSSLGPGSGGGSGGYGGAANSAGSGGGGGGGAVRIIAASVAISGTIAANGGNGGDVTSDRDGGAGGGGSGGTVWLRGTTVDVTGKITATGGTGGKSDKQNGYGGDGGDGAPGRIRFDGYTVNVTGTVSPSQSSGDKSGLSPPAAKLRIDQQPAGTVVMTNESGTAQKVWLVVSW